MAEVALAAAAFEAELGKQLKSLPGVPEVSDHEAVVNRQRCALKLEELINHYVHRLPPYAFAPHLLQTGGELARRQEHVLAARCCFNKLVTLNLPSLPKLSQLDGVGAVAVHVQVGVVDPALVINTTQYNTHNHTKADHLKCSYIPQGS